MIKRFPDGTAKPFLTPSEYAELRDDDRFLYNEGTTPSVRITGDKGRENPAEGAPYGEGLIGRITELETANAQLIKALQEQIAECFDDLCEMCAAHEAVIAQALAQIERTEDV